MKCICQTCGKEIKEGDLAVLVRVGKLKGRVNFFNILEHRDYFHRS